MQCGCRHMLIRRASCFVLGPFNGFFNVRRIGVDEWLRVPSVRDVYAIGDCSGFLESTGKDVLPALAQVVS